MASGDESKWPRQGLTSNKSSLAPRKNAQLCNIYCCLLRKHIMRNCIHNAAKLLKTLCPPTLLSSPPPVCSSPPDTSSPKLKTALPPPSPPLQGLPACFPLLFWAASATRRVSVPVHPDRPASSLVPGPHYHRQQNAGPGTGTLPRRGSNWDSS